MTANSPVLPVLRDAGSASPTCEQSKCPAKRKQSKQSDCSMRPSSPVFPVLRDAGRLVLVLGLHAAAQKRIKFGHRFSPGSSSMQCACKVVKVAVTPLGLQGLAEHLAGSACSPVALGARVAPATQAEVVPVQARVVRGGARVVVLQRESRCGQRRLDSPRGLEKAGLNGTCCVGRGTRRCTAHKSGAWRGRNYGRHRRLQQRSAICGRRASRPR